MLKGVQHLGFGGARGKQNKINISVWSDLAHRVTQIEAVHFWHHPIA
jgi:hypothetical protein